MGPDSVVLLRVSSGTDAPARLGVVYWRQSITVSSGAGTATYTVAFGPQAHAVCSGDGLWYTDGADPTLKRFDFHGRSVLDVPLSLTPKQVSAQDRRRFERDWLGGALEQYWPRLRSVLRQMPFPETLPVVATLLSAEDGDVWVTGSVSADEDRREWYVISPVGEVLARVDVAADLEILDAGRDFLITKRRDELDIEYLDFWEILRNQ